MAYKLQDDMTGRKYNMLYVQERAPAEPADRKGSHWLCRCDCGNICIVRRDKLLGGQKSCGCIRREKEKPQEPEEKRPRGRPAKPRKEIPPENQTVESRQKPGKKPTRPRPFVVTNNQAGNAYGFTQKAKCKHCGKAFERPSGGQWGWMIGNDVCCTYKCMRAEEKKKGLQRLRGEKRAWRCNAGKCSACDGSPDEAFPGYGGGNGRRGSD